MPATSSRACCKRNPFETIDQGGVGELVKIGAERGRTAKPDIKLGVCGEHGGDPESIAFFYDAGLDYVSCSPFRVPIARLAAAQAVLGVDSQRHPLDARTADRHGRRRAADGELRRASTSRPGSGRRSSRSSSIAARSPTCSPPPSRARDPVQGGGDRERRLDLDRAARSASSSSGGTAARRQASTSPAT